MKGGDEYLHRDTRKKVLTELHEFCDTTNNEAMNTVAKVGECIIMETQRVIPPRDSYVEGNWYGNETISHTILDLNKIISFVDKNGVLRNNRQRRALTIVDAIIAGENEGPLEPGPKPIGTLIAGENPIIVDLICSKIMGFDYYKIPTLKLAINSNSHIILNKGIDDFWIHADDAIRINEVFEHYGHLFTPSNGWMGHIEHDYVD